MGEWATEAAKGRTWVADLLRGLPGPMCPKIDKAVKDHGVVGMRARSVRSYDLPKRPREPDEGDYDDLRSSAEAIEGERDEARECLEECRRALDALRNRLMDAVDMIEELGGPPALGEPPACATNPPQGDGGEP